MSSNANNGYCARPHSQFDVVGSGQQTGLFGFAKELVELGLENRSAAGVDRIELFLLGIYSDYRVPSFREASGRDRSDVTQAKYANFHKVVQRSSKSFSMTMRAFSS